MYVLCGRMFIRVRFISDAYVKIHSRACIGMHVTNKCICFMYDVYERVI